MGIAQLPLTAPQTPSPPQAPVGDAMLPRTSPIQSEGLPPGANPQQKVDAYEAFKQRFMQERQLIQSHYDIMKKLPENERLNYLRSMLLTSGQMTAEEFDAAPADHAARFMHDLHNGLGAKARSYEMAPSDAALFFGVEQPKDKY
jgi:hypothetical protein